MPVSEQRKKKRLSRGWALQQEPIKFDAEVENVDTSSESNRKERRKSIGKALKSRLPEPEEAKPHLDDGQLVELYSKCIQLSAQNKINQKNTWSLNLIDNLDDVLSTVGAEDQKLQTTNFQMASCTLDASVKIYSYRVDSVHNDAHQVLGGLNMNLENELAEVANGKEGSKPKRSKKVGVGTTLEKNIANLNVKKFDVEFDVDPLFRKTSAAFDQGGARGLLQHHLNSLLKDKSFLLAFDAEDSAEDVAGADAETGLTVNATGGDVQEDPSSTVNGHEESSKEETARCDDNADQEESSMEEDPAACDPDDAVQKAGSETESTEEATEIARSAFKDIEHLFAPSRLSSVEICASLADFRFNDEETRSSSPEQQDPDYFEPEEDYDDDDDCDVGDDVEIDHLQDNFEELPDLASEGPPAVADEEVSPKQEQEPVFELAKLMFNPEQLKSGWAGPSHWKFTGTQRSRTADPEAPKKRARKKAFFIDFFADVDLDKEFAPPGRASTVLSDAALEKASSDKTTLPPDMHYDMKKLLSLFHRPNCIIRPKSSSQAGSVVTLELISKDGHEERPHIDSSFAGYDDDDDDDDDDVGDAAPFGEFQMEHIEETQGTENREWLNNANLIDQPRMVEKIDISYAKKAKKVDVKALKHSIWDRLVAPAEENVVENEEADNNSDEEPKSFQKILDGLPEQIHTQAMKDISVSYCFICLLHLANEKNLALDQQGDDLLITKNNSRG